MLVLGDFHQPEGVSTLQRLKTDNLAALEADLEEHSKGRPIALVLPCLYSELGTRALSTIVRELRDARYVGEIVVTLGNADREQFEHAKEFFSVLPQRKRVIWNDGERIGEIYARLESEGIGVGGSGKGRAAWIAFGYVLGRGEGRVIALHDCDIVSYTREILARLCYPVTSPELDYEFCKGYYARVTDRLYGRVTRLFVTPVLRALKGLLGHLPLLVYLDSFRYPLAGEFSIAAELAGRIKTPSDWGLEIGTLAEVFSAVPAQRVCQADLCENYEHKHQNLSSQDPSAGLLRMCVDISRTLMRALAAEGVEIAEPFLGELASAYRGTAAEMLVRYRDVASINGLAFDWDGEASAVSTFAEAIGIAERDFQGDPASSPILPCWDGVISSIPDIFERLMRAVNDDNA